MRGTIIIIIITIIIIIVITRAGQGCGPDDLILFVQCLLGGQCSLFICH